MSIHKTAIIANTPLQVLESVIIVCNNVENTYDGTDLYVIDNFLGAEQLINKIISEKYFNNVIRCSPKEKKKNKIATFFTMISCHLLFSTYTYKPDISIKDIEYDKILVGDGNTMGVALYKKCKCEIIAFDDGISSYLGNCFTDNNSNCYRIIGNLLHLGVYSYKINKLYVNSANSCKSTVANIVQQLPRLNQDSLILKRLYDLFEYRDCSEIQRYKFVLLDQVLTEQKGYNRKPFDFFVNAIPEIKSNAILRKHPRKGDAYYSQLQIDNVNNMWELECISTINNEMVLVSVISSSLFSPKIIADKEPYIIFLYRLFIDGEEYQEQCEKSVNIIRSLYNNKEKIFVPTTIEELKNIVDNLI